MVSKSQNKDLNLGGLNPELAIAARSKKKKNSLEKVQRALERV